MSVSSLTNLVLGSGSEQIAKLQLGKIQFLTWLCTETMNFICSHEILRQDYELMQMFKLSIVSQPTQKSGKSDL